MAESTDNSVVPMKSAGSYHPYYFTMFQNYCCGPKSKLATSPSNKDLLPIPEEVKRKADDVIQRVNKAIFENLPVITALTSVIPHEFLDSTLSSDYFRYLVDRIMWKTMSDARVINWFQPMRKLHPIRTSGNGNCLLHAVLMSMVAIHDFDLLMRDLLIQFMDSNKESLKKYWKTDRIRTDTLYGIQSEDSKLDDEWEELCEIVRHENSEDGQVPTSFQYLEAIHVFSVSNLLARPIIILSEDVVRNKHGEAISFNDLFGIYLPILVEKKKCIRQPIVLAYDQSHFCPLLSSNVDNNSIEENFLPLYQSASYAQEQKMLPIKFHGRELSTNETLNVLKDYLCIETMSYYCDSEAQPKPIVCAKLNSKSVSKTYDFFNVYHEYLIDFYKKQSKMVREEEEETKRRYELNRFDNDQYVRENAIRNGNFTSPPSYSSASGYRNSDPRMGVPLESVPSYDVAIRNGTNNDMPNQNTRTFNNTQNSPRALAMPVQIAVQTSHINNNHSSIAANNMKSNVTPVIHKSNNDNLMVNDKQASKNDMNPRSVDSKLKQGLSLESNKHPTIHHTTNQNLIDFDKKTDRLRPCIVCKNYFEDVKSIGLCSSCDYKQVYSAHQISVRHVARLPPPAKTHQSPYAQSDFLSPRQSSTIKTRPPTTINCRYCGNTNKFLYTTGKRDLFCSVCRNEMS